MLKRIAVIVAVLVVVLLVVVAMQPSEFRVTRSARVAAPPAAVFVRIDDLHKWQEWSPWAKLDPAVKNTYAGPASGTGAVFAWSGNKDVGEGRMTIIESRPSELVRITLDFIRPYAATNVAEFTLKPDGEQTMVTWSMAGPKNFAAKAIGLFMDMDKMVGEYFERGLGNLKSVTEAPAKPERDRS